MGPLPALLIFSLGDRTYWAGETMIMMISESGHYGNGHGIIS